MVGPWVGAASGGHSYGACKGGDEKEGRGLKVWSATVHCKDADAERRSSLTWSASSHCSCAKWARPRRNHTSGTRGITATASLKCPMASAKLSFSVGGGVVGGGVVGGGVV